MKVIVKEEGREERLNILKYCLEYSIDTEIISIEDHKGVLIIEWSKKPSEYEIERVNNIWFWGFIENVIEHYINGKKFRRKSF